MKYTGVLLAIMMLTLVSGCEKFRNKPVDMHNSPLVGHWFGERQLQQRGHDIWDRLYISISSDGEMGYHYLSCERGDNHFKSEKNLNLEHMPIIKLKQDELVIQTYPLTPKFDLTLGDWPDKNDGVFVVDGLNLKTTAPVDWANWHCVWPKTQSMH